MPGLHSDSPFRLSEDSISHSRRQDVMWRLRLEYPASMILTSRQHSTNWFRTISRMREIFRKSCAALVLV